MMDTKRYTVMLLSIISIQYIEGTLLGTMDGALDLTMLSSSIIIAFPEYQHNDPPHPLRRIT